MKNTITETQKDFESSSGHTPEYIAWHKLFKREFTAFLNNHGATEIAISKPNHFDASGFFWLDGQIWYFSVGDLRGFKDSMLIRTAEGFKDYTGGRNQYASLRSVEAFTEQFEGITGMVAA
jgi:hypothetical protein